MEGNDYRERLAGQRREANGRDSEGTEWKGISRSRGEGVVASGEFKRKRRGRGSQGGGRSRGLTRRTRPVKYGPLNGTGKAKTRREVGDTGRRAASTNGETHGENVRERARAEGGQRSGGEGDRQEESRLRQKPGKDSGSGRESEVHEWAKGNRMGTREPHVDDLE